MNATLQAEQTTDRAPSMHMLEDRETRLAREKTLRQTFLDRGLRPHYVAEIAFLTVPVGTTPKTHVLHS